MNIIIITIVDHKYSRGARISRIIIEMDNSWPSEKLKSYSSNSYFVIKKCYAMNNIHPSLVQDLNKLSIPVF